MSIFDFPRINIKGLIQVNVGNGNNDDYSLVAGDPSGYSGYTTVTANKSPGQSLRLGNSATVQPYNFISPQTNLPMTDAEFMAWAQAPQDFLQFNNTTTGTPAQAIPGEWNYYGNMGMSMMNTSVVGVTIPSTTSSSGSQVFTSNDPFGLINGLLTFNNRPDSTGRSTAMMIDVNPEAPPASQIFTDNLMLQQGQNVIFNAKPSKASTRWVNFQRNTFLTGPNGAAGTFQCAIPLSALAGQPIVAIMQKYPAPGKKLAGIVFRYTMFRSLQKINYWNYGDNGNFATPAWFQAMIDLYQKQGYNPTYVQVSGTIAPWYEGEMESTETGNFLVASTTNSFHSPGGNTAPGGGPFSLAPAIVNWSPNNPIISIDMGTALPDAYTDPTKTYDPLDQTTDPKFNLGALNFAQRLGSTLFPIGPINYTDTSAGDAAGWIFDYKIPTNLAQAPAPDPNAGSELIWPLYVVNSPTNGDLLVEQRLLFASDQCAVFAEQGLTPTNPSWATMPTLPMTTTTVSSQGYQDTSASFNAFVWGELDNSGVYELWMSNQTYVYPTTRPPLPVLINGAYKPGTPISIPVDTAGVFIITITEKGASANDVQNNINNNMMITPMINCRILPNQQYDQYYTFVNGKPVATAAMNWDALYSEVFRNYYLLYPGMSLIVPLNEPSQWIGPALNTLLDRVDPSAWNTMSNMPRTRDMSATRRWLVQAYCNKFVNQSPPANTTSSLQA